MKWQTCFSSKCDSGYDICMVKSAMQKFLRRRMASQMKWCVLEMYKFKSAVENNLFEEMFYWAFELFINKNDNKLERKVLKRSAPVYLIWEYLLNSKKVKDNINLRKSIRKL